MKKIFLLLIVSFFSISPFAQHDVYMNFSDFVFRVNTVGYRYHVTDHTSFGGDVSFSNKGSMNVISNAKEHSYFQVSSEYLVYFNPKQGCDKFYVGPNLAFRSLKSTHEYGFMNGIVPETKQYVNTEQNVLLSLAVGGTWRHPSGFFFNTNGTLGRSIYETYSTTLPERNIQTRKNKVVFRLGLNIGWQFGKKIVKE